MLMFHPSVLVLLAIVAFFLIWGLVAFFGRLNTKSKMEQTLCTELDDHNLTMWQSSSKIQSLLSMYMNMCIKHGPNSEEAEWFRFGIDNQEFSSLYGREALDAFNMVADCFKKNYEKQLERKMGRC